MDRNPLSAIGSLPRYRGHKSLEMTTSPSLVLYRDDIRKWYEVHNAAEVVELLEERGLTTQYVSEHFRFRIVSDLKPNINHLRDKLQKWGFRKRGTWARHDDPRLQPVMRDESVSRGRLVERPVRRNSPGGLTSPASYRQRFRDRSYSPYSRRSRSRSPDRRLPSRGHSHASSSGRYSKRLEAKVESPDDSIEITLTITF